MPAPERKVAYVQEMFGRIALHYDLMNGLMTLGRDGAWRRYTVERVVPSVGPAGVSYRNRILDVATGTGDLGLEALRQRPGAQVVGVDLVAEMMAVAQRKIATLAPQAPIGSKGKLLELAAGDALRLPFPTGSFDAVVTGFALRNVTDIPAAFAEMARVTRPGGRIGCLEIAKPRLPLFRSLFALYFYRLVPLLGRLIAGESRAYTYLPHSLTAFLTPDQIATVMRQTGWQDVRYRRLMLGTVAVHSGIRA